MTAMLRRTSLAAASLLALAGCDAPTARADKAELVWRDGGHFALDGHALEIARQIQRVLAQHS